MVKVMETSERAPPNDHTSYTILMHRLLDDRREAPVVPNRGHYVVTWKTACRKQMQHGLFG